MASLIKYQKKGTLSRLQRKVQIREFRNMLGNLQREAANEDRQEMKVDMRNFMKNPMEIYSKKNVEELDRNLRNLGNLQREYIDDIGLNQTIVDAPTNDIDELKKANAKALAWDNQLSPDPSLLADTLTAQKSLEDRAATRRKNQRDRKRRLR